jgi:DHA1 family multidrug resistance protein-like MFS transporter
MKNWKFNFALVWLSQFVILAGFAASSPFFAFYIRELGVTDVNQLALWSGAVNSVGPVMIAVMSPLWGLLADRRGRKLMLQRAAFGQALGFGAMAFAGNVYQLFGLRILQGAMAGTIPAGMALVASFVPSAQLGFALGLMQMSTYAGLSLGPLIGGVLADHFGYRWAFGFTGILFFLSGLMILFLVREQFERPKPGSARAGLMASAGTMFRTLPVLAAVVTMAGVYLADATPRPILPLFVEGLQSNAGRVNTSTGLVYGAASLASALSAVLIGRTADGKGRPVILLVGSLGAGLAYLAQGSSSSLTALIAAGFATGLCVGGLLPTANAALARATPREQQGAIYGLSHAINHIGSAIGPMLGAAIATAGGLRAPFMAAASVMVLVAVVVALMTRPRGPASTQPSNLE